jgi:hypothetical protein
MPDVRCGQCDREFAADPSLRGKKAACPSCGALAWVPAGEFAYGSRTVQIRHPLLDFSWRLVGTIGLVLALVVGVVIFVAVYIGLGG